MEGRFGDQMLRTLVIAVPLFCAGSFMCSTSLHTTDSSIICLFMVFIGVMSVVIAWLPAGWVRKERFVRVPRPEYFDDEDVEDEKPKRGE